MELMCFYYMWNTNFHSLYFSSLWSHILEYTSTYLETDAKALQLIN